MNGFFKEKLKFLKKGEIAIYAIALMLVGAGYLNYSSIDNAKTEETYSEDVEGLVAKTETNDVNIPIGEATLVSSQDVESSNENVDENKTEEKSSSSELVPNNEVDSKEDINKTEQEKNTITENTQQTSATDDISNYFANSKLDRDTMYANMISNYQSILNNTNCSEAQKSIATQEISKINNNKNAIMICENLITAKGFSNCVVLINDESINVVVSVEGGLTKQKVSQIQNIVSRELKSSIEKIHISEK